MNPTGDELFLNAAFLHFIQQNYTNKRVSNDPWELYSGASARTALQSNVFCSDGVDFSPLGPVKIKGASKALIYWSRW